MNDVSFETSQQTGLSKIESWFSAKRFAIFLGLVLFANFPEVIWGSYTFFYRDYLSIVYPYAKYNHDCFWRGELPLWNPLNHCGVPYLAQWQTFVLYPGWWIFVPLPPSWSVGIYTLLHCFFGGMTMYFLARRWTNSPLGGCIAGIIYCFNGLMQNSLSWPHIVAAMSWAPLVILAVDNALRGTKKQVLLAALASGLQMLTGAAEQIGFTWMMIALLTGFDVFKKDIRG